MTRLRMMGCVLSLWSMYPKGDIVFQNVTTNIRSSSKVLSLASPVFDGISSQGPQTFSDPEDDAETLTLPCRLLHHRLDPEEVRTPPSMGLLVKFAKLGAKYSAGSYAIRRPGSVRESTTPCANAQAAAQLREG
ncbi:hypothetical protein VTN00DRAFT_8387 [Thermoascus crustaceus]|uniref:uncharacterized protein n=1 Tax=Thermoascus crustaceus TaxID=5088 RepID=UPI003742E2BC